ncbi:hypothetical protein QYM36_002587 [Artemia franciscana]|uniref:Uncharacterized protein n=1 Tax=Artemia franciscana TaxID=6661 RepID=A0AA88LHQ0_ARTSF|nr:hypothetical protein QYM36_019197 [Artemia franciscana]KAK2722085.1 hypothetical protein QYM36_002587 [Artemia franciscana]
MIMELFLDDARIKNFTSCYKDKTFLKFFFSRIRINETGCHEDFPYISPCGRERNYIRCDDLPIVFTHLIYKDANPYLTYGLAGDDLCVKFNPNELTMYPDSGRVYHPGLEDLNGVGLVCSNLAIEFSKYFEFENGEESLPTHFRWNDEKIILQNTVLSLLEELKRRGRS